MGLVDNVKAAAEIAQKVGSIELYRQLLEVQQAAMELTEKNAALFREVTNLKDQLRERDERERLGIDLEFTGNVYVRKGDTTRAAYCPKCWDVDRKLVHLLRAGAAFKCINCNQSWLSPQARSEVRIGSFER